MLRYIIHVFSNCTVTSQSICMPIKHFLIISCSILQNFLGGKPVKLHNKDKNFGLNRSNSKEQIHIQIRSHIVLHSDKYQSCFLIIYIFRVLTTSCNLLSMFSIAKLRISSNKASNTHEISTICHACNMQQYYVSAIAVL